MRLMGQFNNEEILKAAMKIATTQGNYRRYKKILNALSDVIQFSEKGEYYATHPMEIENANHS
jgi:hypothetical protein